MYINIISGWDPWSEDELRQVGPQKHSLLYPRELLLARRKRRGEIVSSQALNYCPSLCVSAEGRVIIGILGGGGGGEPQV